MHTTKPVIKDADLVEAYNYKQRNKTIVKFDINQTATYFIPADVITDTYKAECKRYVEVLNEGEWENLRELFEFFKSFHLVKINDADWENSLCSCVHAQKNYFFSHIIVVAAKLKLMDFEKLLMDLPLERKIARGRKKMPHCLTKPKQTAQQVGEKAIVDAQAADVQPSTSKQSRKSGSKRFPSPTYQLINQKSFRKSKRN